MSSELQEQSDEKEPSQWRDSILLWGGVLVFLCGIILFGVVKLGAFDRLPVLDSSPESFPLVSLSPAPPLEGEIVLSFSCPSCATFWNETIAPLTKDYPSFRPKISFFPLSEKGEEMEWFLLLTCAEKQGKSRSDLIPLVWAYPPEEKKSSYLATATGIPEEVILSCVQEDETKLSILAERKALREKGVKGTPTLFLNGNQYDGGLPKENIELEILKREPAKTQK